MTSSVSTTCRTSAALIRRPGQDICCTAWGRNKIFLAAAWRICCKMSLSESMSDNSRDRGALLQLRLCWRPNATPQPLPEAGAQRTLEAVGCRRLLGARRCLPHLRGSRRTSLGEARTTFSLLTRNAHTTLTHVGSGCECPGNAVQNPPQHGCP